MGSYIPSTASERQEMLSALGMKSTMDLYSSVPEEVLIKELAIPSGCSELEVKEKVSALAAANHVYGSIFRGAGAYQHYIPSIVKTIVNKEEFVTAYTPYQAEISQGVLQSIFEYQTQMCRLTGMDVSNASVYDGGVAAAEAVFMCQERKKQGVIVSATVDPKVLAVIKTYCESRSVEVTVIPAKDYATDVEGIKAALTDKSACVYVQSPNYYGIIEDMDAVTAAAHEAGAKVIMGVNPISLGLLKTPGEYGVDIAVGEGQPLGMALGFGGPYLGFMTTTNAMVRKLPGRIVGQTVDHDGRRCFVLTLQAREQHIRREKASSNICSNEALCAMTASVYLAAVGPTGLKKAASSSAAHAHYLAEELGKIPGFAPVSDKAFFHEFLTTCPIDAKVLEEKLSEKNILSGLPIALADGSEGILWCCTELSSKAKIDALVEAIKEICQEVA